MGPQGHYQLEDGLYDKPRSRKKTYLYSALVLLLLIAAGVGIGVVVSRLTADVRTLCCCADASVPLFLRSADILNVQPAEGYLILPVHRVPTQRGARSVHRCELKLVQGGVLHMC